MSVSLSMRDKKAAERKISIDMPLAVDSNELVLCVRHITQNFGCIHKNRAMIDSNQCEIEPSHYQFKNG